jgi:hypothetical protein
MRFPVNDGNVHKLIYCSVTPSLYVRRMAAVQELVRLSSLQLQRPLLNAKSLLTPSLQRPRLHHNDAPPCRRLLLLEEHSWTKASWAAVVERSGHEYGG